jgi:aspartate-semialdehyde dehydrogenase
VKLRAGVLGATGAVGQRFVQLLSRHPWFELTAVAASERSAGKCYAEACAWRLDVPMPESVRALPVQAAEPGLGCDLVFSALDAAVAGPVEEAFAAAGCAVLSNARNHRMDEDVPLLVPEVNPDHTGLVEAQRRRRGWRGIIVTNPYCSTATLALALAPLDRNFGLESVAVTTLQAISGAGYPGLPSLDILGNVVPYIAGEEEKIERETRKILGTLTGDTVVFHPATVSAQATRVPVVDGHTAAVFVSLKREAALDEVPQSSADSFLQKRFTDARRPKRATDKRLSHCQLASQQRRNQIIEHRSQFARRAGQHDQPTRTAAGTERVGIHFEGEARSGPVRIGQNASAFGHQCLDAGARGHRPVARGEKAGDMRQHRRVFAQGFAEQLRD